MYKKTHWSTKLTQELAEELDAHNLPLYKENLAKMGELRTFVRSLYGEKSKEFRYVKNMAVPRPETYVDILKATKEREEAEAAKRAENKKLVEAVKYLLANAVTELYLDPIYQANEHRREKLIEESSGRELTFYGREECNSFTVGDHRCSCGNRRVDIRAEGDFEDMYIYGEAY